MPMGIAMRSGGRLLLLPVLALILYSVFRLGTAPPERVLRTNPKTPPVVSHQGNRPDLRPPTTFDPPKFKPVPTNTPTPVADPFPWLADTESTPPPIPSHNEPRHNLHQDYGLESQPPLFIGFTRQWPMLLQCVVSYITAGWPASSIVIVDNTGTQFANRQGLLSLQNPFYLNYTTLERLGVNVIQTPTLLNFAQLQNFFLHTAHVQSWPYYFYSHQDILVFSWEQGYDANERPGDHQLDYYDEEDRQRIESSPPAGEEGYRTIYENALLELQMAVERDPRWGTRWFQYDHLTLMNRDALDAIGGWDTLIPYYGTDCDFNGRMKMDGWSTLQRRIGIINDVSTTLADLAGLYRVPGVNFHWVDLYPNTTETDDKPSWFRDPLRWTREKEEQIELEREREEEQRQREEAMRAKEAELEAEQLERLALLGPPTDYSGARPTAGYDVRPPQPSSAYDPPRILSSEPQGLKEEEDYDHLPTFDTSEFPDVPPASPGTDYFQESRYAKRADEKEDPNKKWKAAETLIPINDPEHPLEGPAYFDALVLTGNVMGEFKWRDVASTRNQWQTVQQGGFGEPYYYDPRGFAVAFDKLTDAGRYIYKTKWGHESCELVGETALSLQDAWLVEPDWQTSKNVFGF